MIRDRNINYKYQNLWIGAQAWDKNLLFVDAGDAGELLTEVQTSGIMGWQFDGGDDSLYHTLATPTHIDWDNSVFYRIVYAVDTASDLTETFSVSASGFSFGALPATTPPTAFVTVSGVPDSAETVVATAWGKADSSTTDGITGTSDMLRLYVTNTTEGDAQQAYMVGLELRFLPKLTDGPQTNDQTDPTDA